MAQIFSYGQKYLAEQIQLRLDYLIKEYKNEPVIPMIPIPILANYLGTEVFSNLKWWLDNEMPHPPEEMDKIFHQLILPGFKSAWDNSESSDSKAKSKVV